MNKLNTTAKGDIFEAEVFQFIKNNVNAGETFLNPKKCSFFSKKGYFSQKRGRDICFDISIESFNQSPDKLAQLTIIECKNLKHNTPVDDVEEFANKLDQIRDVFGFKVKGMMFSRSEYASGAISVADAYGIGLARLLSHEQVDWILERTPKYTNVKNLRKDKKLEIIKGLTSNDFRGQSEALFLCHEDSYSTSFLDIFNSLIGENHNKKKHKIKNIKQTSSVPYIGLEDIEQRVSKVLKYFKENGILDNSQVDLKTISDYFSKEHNIEFLYDKDLGVNSQGKEILGKLEFENKKILVSNSLELNSPRWRFTLAHEIGHLILHRNLNIPSLLNNHIDTNEIMNWKNTNKQFTNLMKLEWQANTFASSLLLPRDLVFEHVRTKLEELDIRNFTNGLIYLDEQKCNINTYQTILFDMRSHFNVSYKAINYRLSQLKILNNQSKQQNVNNLISGLKIIESFNIDIERNLLS